MRISIFILSLFFSGMVLAETANCDFFINYINNYDQPTLSKHFTIKLEKMSDLGFTGYIGSKEFKVEGQEYNILANFSESPDGRRELRLNLFLNPNSKKILMLESVSQTYQSEVSATDINKTIGVACELLI
jgi:hypothetical protein